MLNINVKVCTVFSQMKGCHGNQGFGFFSLLIGAYEELYDNDDIYYSSFTS